MPNTKPFVIAATACEKVLVEKDGVASVIRLVDTFFVPELSPDISKSAKQQISALVVLKSGDVRGSHEVALRMRSPDGTNPLPEFKWPVIFNGDEHGVNISINLELPATLELGLYWVDVMWQGEVLSSFPIKLVRQQKVAAIPPSEKN